MYIKFKSISIENFQSIKTAFIELSNRGIVLIKGINNYEDNAKSNGSGKSSCIEAIYYALYGKTSSGITNPSNRYTKSGCMVKLVFYIDDQEYTIIRSNKHDKYKTSLVLYKGEKDISGRNKSDTDKLIKSDIFPISQDIFLSSIFLSQGFSNRLSNLTPSGRKERIEVLTDTSSKIERFKSRILSKKSEYDNLYNDTIRDESYNEGLKANIESQILEIENTLKESDKKYPDIDKDELLTTIKNLESSITIIDKQISELRAKHSQASTEVLSMNNNKSIKLSSIKTIKSNLNHLTNSKDSICPTCKQIISNKNKASELIESYKSDLETNLKDLSTINSKLVEYIDNRDSIQKDISITEDKRNIYYKELNRNRKLYSDIMPLNIDKNSLTDKVVKLKSNLLDINNTIDKINNEISRIELLRDISNHCGTIVSKQFRGYLLENTINFINSRLVEYSNMIFSNTSDIIKLVVDSSKLDIYLGDALYDTLSGGEKRKVDLAIVLAQRDLALNIAGFSCNILIMDEVYDGLDESAINTVTSMFSEISSEIDSMFIISHKPEAEIPYDSIITITKGKDRISTISTI